MSKANSSYLAANWLTISGTGALPTWACCALVGSITAPNGPNEQWKT